MTDDLDRRLLQPYNEQLLAVRAQADAADLAWQRACEACAARVKALTEADPEYQRLAAASDAAYRLAREWRQVVDAKAATLNTQYWEERRKVVTLTPARRRRRAR